VNDFNPIKIQKFLSGVDYPADRDQLIQAAKSNGADKDTLDQLRQLPDRNYDGPSGVSKELAKSS
jgi:hypothetical protein